MSKEEAVQFLFEMQAYFIKLQAATRDDKAYWGFGQNATNCGIIAFKLENGDFK